MIISSCPLDSTVKRKYGKTLFRVCYHERNKKGTITAVMVREVLDLKPPKLGAWYKIVPEADVELVYIPSL